MQRLFVMDDDAKPVEGHEPPDGKTIHDLLAEGWQVKDRWKQGKVHCVLLERPEGLPPEIPEDIAAAFQIFLARYRDEPSGVGNPDSDSDSDSDSDKEH